MRGAISFAASVSLDASTGPFFARQKTEFSEASQAYFSAPFRHARKKIFFRLQRILRPNYERDRRHRSMSPIGS